MGLVEQGFAGFLTVGEGGGRNRKSCDVLEF